MQTSKGNLFTRDDTFFGVCEGLGEDLRIPSNLFRAAFALGFFFSPQGAVITYAALGVLVLVSRLVSRPPAPLAVRRRGRGRPACGANRGERLRRADGPRLLPIAPDPRRPRAHTHRQRPAFRTSGYALETIPLNLPYRPSAIRGIGECAYA
jgi:phage shock protein PspC (stress-responsive transcriptional regulator)